MLSRFMRRYEQWAQRNYGLIRGNKTSVDNQWNLIRPLRRINIVIITRDTSNKKKKKGNINSTPSQLFKVHVTTRLLDFFWIALHSTNRMEFVVENIEPPN